MGGGALWTCWSATTWPQKTRPAGAACAAWPRFISFGQRVQKSVFECSVNEMRLEQMRARLLDCIDQKADSLRIYRLIEPREEHVESYGRDTYVDFEEPLVL